MDHVGSDSLYYRLLSHRVVLFPVNVGLVLRGMPVHGTAV